MSDTGCFEIAQEMSYTRVYELSRTVADWNNAVMDQTHSSGPVIICSPDAEVAASVVYGITHERVRLGNPIMTVMMNEDTLFGDSIDQCLDGYGLALHIIEQLLEMIITDPRSSEDAEGFRSILAKIHEQKLLSHSGDFATQAQNKLYNMTHDCLQFAINAISEYPLTTEICAVIDLMSADSLSPTQMDKVSAYLAYLYNWTKVKPFIFVSEKLATELLQSKNYPINAAYAHTKYYELIRE